MLQKLYKLIFWFGYLLVFTMAFVPLKNDLHKHIVSLLSLKFHLDQVLHAIVYFLICIYFITGEQMGLRLFRADPLKKFILVIVFLAVLSESVQLFVPYRSFNIFDMLANLIGVGIGMVIVGWMRIKDIRAKGIVSSE